MSEIDISDLLRELANEANPGEGLLDDDNQSDGGDMFAGGLFGGHVSPADTASLDGSLRSFDTTKTGPIDEDDPYEELRHGDALDPKPNGGVSSNSRRNSDANAAIGNPFDLFEVESKQPEQKDDEAKIEAPGAGFLTRINSSMGLFNGTEGQSNERNSTSFFERIGPVARSTENDESSVFSASDGYVDFFKFVDSMIQDELGPGPYEFENAMASFKNCNEDFLDEITKNKFDSDLVSSMLRDAEKQILDIYSEIKDFDDNDKMSQRAMEMVVFSGTTNKKSLFCNITGDLMDTDEGRSMTDEKNLDALRADLKRTSNILSDVNLNKYPNHPSIADIVEGYSVLDHFLGSRVNTVSDRMESAEAVVRKLIEIEDSTERGKRFSEYVLERLKQTSRSYFTEWLRFLLQFLEVLSKLLEEYAECSKREGVLQSYLRFLLGCADYKAFVISHNPLTVCKDEEEYAAALEDIRKSPNGADTVIMNTLLFIHDTLADAGLDMCAEFDESAPRNMQYMFGLIDDAVYHHELAGIFQVDLLHAFCDHKGEARKRALILLAQNVGNLILHEVQTLQDGYAVDLSSLRTDVFNRGSIPKHRTASLSSETKLLNILMNEFKKEMRSLRLRKGDDTDDARKDLGQKCLAARAKLRILHTYQSRLQALVAHQQLNPMTLASMDARNNQHT